MPLTDFQRVLLALLAQTRAADSYLAGGAALHFAPNSVRYSDDLDFFHDSPERVASAFSDDWQLLEEAGYGLEVEISQPLSSPCHKGKETAIGRESHGPSVRIENGLTRRQHRGVNDL